MADAVAAPRVLLACLPATGLINPLLAVAAELSRRDVADLWFATTDEARAGVEGVGGPRPAAFVSLGRFHEDWPDIWDEADLGRMSRGDRLRALRHFLDLTIDHEFDRRQYRRMLEVIDEVRPDLMVVDANSAWALDAAQTRGVPFVLSMPMPASSVFLDRLPSDYPTPFSGLPREMDAAQQRQNRKFRRGVKLTFFRPKTLRSMLEAVNQRKKAGIVNVNGIPSKYADAARAIIGYSTFDVEYSFPAVPEHLTMVGHAVTAEPDKRLPGTELGEWLDAHESVVYIGFGSIMRLTAGQVRGVLDACRRLGDRHAVLWKLPKSQRGLLPPDAEIPASVRFEDWVPSQTEVLAHPHVRMFFHHGGGNAVHEALHYDKPQLVMPFWTDCYDLAARVVDRGVGLDVPTVENPDSSQIAASLLRVLTEDRFRVRAAELGARIRAAGGPPAAVDVVEKALTANR